MVSEMQSSKLLLRDILHYCVEQFRHGDQFLLPKMSLGLFLCNDLSCSLIIDLQRTPEPPNRSIFTFTKLPELLEDLPNALTKAEVPIEAWTQVLQVVQSFCLEVEPFHTSEVSVFR